MPHAPDYASVSERFAELDRILRDAGPECDAAASHESNTSIRKRIERMSSKLFGRDFANAQALQCMIAFAQPGSVHGFFSRIGRRQAVRD
jgi:hypothetical protein